ncbi:ABC transporter permease [Sphingorhabdus contaminans]|uniref:FtsX-like permease family protein n=1 Tax=Sphingorhabdus contaminans TaxID=1343899 RepID=A0A553WK69_9SPHN|nr:ABC transporter permease [Sphingorhabdus contaminans]TSB05082.1 FtsX-like permease family protein [Sphingorhabdus contaminans]
MNSIFASVAGWGVNVAIAFTALRTNLMRSILTTLGVMIGVFSVILAVAVGNGAQVSVTQQIATLGSNMAIVVPQPDSGSGPPRPNDRGRLTERDGQAILRQVSGVRAVAPQIRNSVQLVTPGRSATTQATGATPEYGNISNVNASEGRFLTKSDVGSAARVAVIGQTVSDKLFGGDSPVGQTIRVNRVPFTVVGLLESKGSNLGTDNDDQIVVPITTLRQRLLTTPTQGPDDVTLLFVGFEDEDSLLAGQKEIKRLLRDRYRVQKGKINPFTVRTTTEIAETTSQVTQIFQAVLVAIASISLLVGGIGIMNIMLVSVTERTREIGLRMALGARRSDIRNQFLVEAAVLCIIGGAIGLLLAVLAATIFQKVADFPAPVGIDTALFSIAFSAVIGLLFGGYPAVRASRLSPIEALRSE